LLAAWAFIGGELYTAGLAAPAIRTCALMTRGADLGCGVDGVLDVLTGLP